MNRLVFDIETDGLLPELTQIHSVCIRDAESGELVASCTDASPDYPSVQHGLDILAGADLVAAHNGIGFDLPAIHKLHPRFKLRGTLYDTLVLARMAWNDIKKTDFERARQGTLPKRLIGRHSMEAWGCRLGLHKLDYTGWCKEQGISNPWDVWRPEMQTYCEGDTATNVALYRRLQAAALPEEAVETELELAYYLRDQEANGWPFDLEGAYALQAKLSARRQRLGEQLSDHFGTWYVYAGEFTPKRDHRGHGYVAGCTVSKIALKEFNPASQDHIANRLATLYGWKATSYTPTGKPQVDETALAGLDFPMVAELREYLTVDKRLQQLSEGSQAWLKQVSPEGKIHHRVNSSGTITHRASHSNPNIAQVPRVGKPYGAECRELFKVPTGWVLVGSDVSGLELRCLAHYMAKYDDGAYGRVLLEGDIHSANQDALGLDGGDSRDTAKTFIYAYLYGAGDEKLGSIIGPDAPPPQQRRLGKQYRGRFERNTPALGHLTAAVRARAHRAGFLRLIDGRVAKVRSPHSALNTLLQGTGAVICKRWIVHARRRFEAEFGPQGWTGAWAALGWIHDEVQIAVRPDHSEAFCKILVDEIEGLTDHYSFRIPLTGEAKVGSTWRETH